MILQCANHTLDVTRPRIMGILNVTPDSFSDGGLLYRGQKLDRQLVLAKARQMIDDGADIIDVGGESTRPGAALVSLDEEWQRVVPVVEIIAAELPVIISVDTSRAEIITAAAAAGAGLVNDVRALQRPGALAAAAATGLPVCLMHMQGEPDSMQNQPAYADVVEEVLGFLDQRVAQCLAAGIDKTQILLDPGFGFGKSVEHNLRLLQQLPRLQALACPVLVGLSRKSLIGNVLGRDVDQRLAGSLGLALAALQRGASILRVHDVRETADAMAMWLAVDDVNEELKR